MSDEERPAAQDPEGDTDALAWHAPGHEPADYDRYDPGLDFPAGSPYTHLHAVLETVLRLSGVRPGWPGVALADIREHLDPPVSNHAVHRCIEKLCEDGELYPTIADHYAHVDCDVFVTALGDCDDAELDDDGADELPLDIFADQLS